MNFIGRKAELEKLNAEYERDSSFVVIYGRRRAGKTTLIKEFLKKKAGKYQMPLKLKRHSQDMKSSTTSLAKAALHNDYWTRPGKMQVCC